MSALVNPHVAESKRALHDDSEQCRALVGRRLADRFEVGSIIGYGGSSLIFEGWHMVLRHPVAVKVLRADYAHDPELVNHFAQEAMVTAQMRSPHVVRVFDTGMIDETVPYTVLELLRGQTLNELRRNGRTFSPEEALDLILQACRALDESHRRGIIHRDIKPDNLFLAELPDGAHVLKVIDFGVAKHGNAHTFLSEAWVGTPGYMAPEQISNPSAVDHRADIWALGVVLFELLTGRSPFRGTTGEELLASTLSDEALPLRVAHQGLPVEVYEAVERCLAKNPALRFQTIQDFVNALSGVRQRFERGELSTGIGSLPGTWDVRLTPPHGWAVPGPTIALKPSTAKFGLRRRLSLGAGLIAGAVFGIGVAYVPLHEISSVENTYSAAVFETSPRPDAHPSTELKAPRIDLMWATASAEQEAQPEAVVVQPALQLVPPTRRDVQVPTRAVVEPAVPPTNISVASSAAAGVGAATTAKLTAKSVAHVSNESPSDEAPHELLTPWTKK